MDKQILQNGYLVCGGYFRTVLMFRDHLLCYSLSNILIEPRPSIEIGILIETDH